MPLLARTGVSQCDSASDFCVGLSVQLVGEEEGRGQDNAKRESRAPEKAELFDDLGRELKRIRRIIRKPDELEPQTSEHAPQPKRGL